MKKTMIVFAVLGVLCVFAREKAFSDEHGKGQAIMQICDLCQSVCSQEAPPCRPGPLDNPFFAASVTDDGAIVIPWIWHHGRLIKGPWRLNLDGGCWRLSEE